MSKAILKIFSFTFLIVWSTFAVANTSTLVVDLSTKEVKVSSSFVGTNVMVFGTNNQHDNIIVVIMGPHETTTVRKKQRVSGIWINREKMEFKEVPGFYAIASTRPLNEIAEQRLLKRHNIGIRNTITDNFIYQEQKEIQNYRSFKEALIRGKKKKGLFLDDPLKIDVISERLFKASFHFPNNMTTGKYTVNVFAFREKSLVNMVSKTISVEKTGIGADVFKFAKEQSALYGLIAIVIAVLSGWIASVIFRKI